VPDHIFIVGWIKRENYTSPGSGRSNIKTPSRDRVAHGSAMKKKFEQAWEASKARKSNIAVVSGNPNGFYVEFDSDKKFPLDLEKLDLQSHGIELVAVRRENEVERATVFIPEGKVQLFLDRFEDYLTRDTRFGKPKNKSLVESIADLRLATLESFWTESMEPFPPLDEKVWWEVWLRNDNGNELVGFRELAKRLNLTIGSGHLSFPDRTVVLAFASPAELTQSLDLLNYFAELRKAKELPAFFARLTPTEQVDWVNELLGRTTFPAENAPAICILDTGVNRSHPLLEHSLADTDMHSFRPNWGTADHAGHGTEMAGVALFEDLAARLTSSDPVLLSHRLESAKIVSPVEKNAPDLYGVITADAAARAELAAPSRLRIFLMAISAEDQRDRGLPTSWSAELDSLSAAVDDPEHGARRLFVLSAGNRTSELSKQYFDDCLTDSIHDPGQSWNALTVGGYTERTLIMDPDVADWQVLAQVGELCPQSTTSVTWAGQWPIKPDIVMEGGNYAISPDAKMISSFDDLSLLTTYYQFPARYFTTTGDTSGAAAMAANMAAVIQAKYPRAWPETIRAILVHSARWSPQMKAQADFDEARGRKNLSVLLRSFGYGAPSLPRALESTSNALTLIAQERIYPYEADKTKEMILHTLPWPKDQLQALGEAEVRLRVTLSYFVEPNPARRGWNKRHRYASHGLRFDVKTATESVDEFRSRLNKQAREEEEESITSGDSKAWLVGPMLRGKGSIHSDVWTGTAADLAERGYIGVYPVIGWWRVRHQLNRWQLGARYALLVSIETKATDVDLYIPVSNMVETEILT
jgi:hypothetical protein